jgi:hypothetical protein
MAKKGKRIARTPKSPKSAKKSYTRTHEQKRPAKSSLVLRHGTVYFHTIELTHIAFMARDRAREDAKRPNALPTDALVSVVMAIVAAEAFINELPECIRAGENSLPVTPEMLNCAELLDRAEKERESIVEKYQIAARALSGKAFAKGRALLQDFILLVRIRNEIVHLKPAWSSQNHAGRKLSASLEQRGMSTVSASGFTLPWLNVLEDPKVATWACETARAIMLAVLDLTPECSDGREWLDPFHSLKTPLRDRARFSP